LEDFLDFYEMVAFDRLEIIRGQEAMKHESDDMQELPE